MWYVYITDEKGERFNPVAWVITYLTEVFRKHDCSYAKWSHYFVMSFQIIISLEKEGTGLLVHRNGSFHRNQLSSLWCDMFTTLMRKVRDLILLQERSHTWRMYQSATAASQNEVINLWCHSRLSSPLQGKGTGLIIHRNVFFHQK